MGKINHSDIIQRGNPFEEASRGVSVFTRELTRLRNATGGELRRNLDALSNINLSRGNGIRTYSRQLDVLQDSVSKFRNIESQIRNIERLGNIKFNSGSLRDLNRQLGQLNRNSNTVGNSSQILNRNINNIGGSSTRAISGIRAFSGASISSSRGLSLFGGGVSSLKNLLGGLGATSALVAAPLAILGGLFLMGVKSLIPFTRELSQLEAISGGSAQQMELLSENAVRLGRSTQFTSVQVLQLSTELSRLGFTTSEILRASDAILDLSIISGQSLPRSAKLAGSTIRALGLDAGQAGRVVDVLAESFTTTGSDASIFQNSIKFVGPIARAVGVEIETLAASVGVLSDAGFTGSTSGTALRRILTELGTEGSKAARSVGFVVRSSDDLIRAFTVLRDRGLGVDEATRLFGRSASAASIVLAENSFQLDILANNFSNADGAAREMAETVSDNFTGDVTRLSSAWDGLVRNFGNLRPVRAVVNFFTRLTGSVNELLFGSDRIVKEIQSQAASFTELGGRLAFLQRQHISLRSRLRDGLLTQEEYSLALTTNTKLIDSNIASLGLSSKANLAINNILLDSQGDYDDLNSRIEQYNDTLNASEADILSTVESTDQLTDSQKLEIDEINNTRAGLRILSRTLNNKISQDEIDIENEARRVAQLKENNIEYANRIRLINNTVDANTIRSEAVNQANLNSLLRRFNEDYELQNLLRAQGFRSGIISGRAQMRINDRLIESTRTNTSLSEEQRNTKLLELENQQSINQETLSTNELNFALLGINEDVFSLGEQINETLAERIDRYQNVREIQNFISQSEIQNGRFFDLNNRILSRSAIAQSDIAKFSAIFLSQTEKASEQLLLQDTINDSTISSFLNNIVPLSKELEVSAQRERDVRLDILNNSNDLSISDEQRSRTATRLQRELTSILSNRLSIQTKISDNQQNINDLQQRSARNTSSSVTTAFNEFATALGNIAGLTDTNSRNFQERIEGMRTSYLAFLRTLLNGGKLTLAEFNQLVESVDSLSETTSESISDISTQTQNRLQRSGRAAINITDSVFSVLSNRDAVRSAEINAEFENRSESLQTQLDNNIISQEEYDNSLEQLESERDSRQLEIRREQFNRDKISSVAQAAINIALGITSALRSPETAPFVIPLISTVGAVQIASILSQQFPEAEKGATWTESGNRHSSGGNDVSFGGKKINVEKGERVSIFNRSATSKHDVAIKEFTERLNGGGDIPFNNDLLSPPSLLIAPSNNKRLEELMSRNNELSEEVLRMKRNTVHISGNKVLDAYGNIIKYVVN